jgi:hypothetical protein
MNEIQKLAYSPHELSIALSISIPTLARDRASGSSGGIPFVVIGGRILYPSQLVQEWLNKRSTQGNQDKIKVMQTDGIKRLRGRPKGTTKLHLSNRLKIATIN